PRWWTGWWPPSLRPAGDVWRRLPRGVQRLRVILAGLVVAFGLVVVPVLAMAIPFMATFPRPSGQLAARAIFDSIYSLTGGFVLVGLLIALVQRKYRALGLTRVETHKLMFE